MRRDRPGLAAVLAVLVVGAFIAVALTGCGTATSFLGGSINQDIDKYGKKFADAYCTQPLSVRESDSRVRVNQAIAPHRVELDCFGDPKNPAPIPPAQPPAPASKSSGLGPVDRAARLSDKFGRTPSS
jgi:hypothetical protein